MSKKYYITGNTKLNGHVEISGAKNAALPILAASILSSEEVVIHNVPPLSDILTMIQILKEIGLEVQYLETENTVVIKGPQCKDLNTDLSLPQIAEIRASILVGGALIGKCHKVVLPLPGGCKIGARPIDLHLKAFSLLGVDSKQEYGNIYLFANDLVGNEVYLDFPSVGATENTILASVLASGETIIKNSAIEPEIVDLCNFLNSMGANIVGIGTDTITVYGVNKLKGCEYSIIPDRIEAGTYMIATAITRGQCRISNVCIKDLTPIVNKLRETGVTVTEGNSFVEVDATTLDYFKPVDIKTLPHPGFPTDMQSQFASLLSVAKGTSIITETIFENRFMYVAELARMGCDIKVDGRIACIEGIAEPTGAKVKATDLRSGAGLVLLALASKGDTEISDIFHIERGYFDFDKKLNGLGANIKVEECS